ncbi:Unknown protein sequence [Pseudomonas amygdali pv. morsprunorum]|nr:Unknown protein sequence [Pseudomonas amygdali pv. morsprunorum]
MGRACHFALDHPNIGRVAHVHKMKAISDNINFFKFHDMPEWTKRL